MADFSLEQFINTSDDVFSIAEDREENTPIDVSADDDNEETPTDDGSVNTDDDNEPIEIGDPSDDDIPIEEPLEGANNTKKAPAKKVETTPTNQQNEDTDPSDDSIYNQYYNILRDNEFLLTSDDFKFDGTPESLAEAIEQSKQNLRLKTAETVMGELPEDFKPLFEYAINGGTDLKAYLDTYKEVDLKDLEVKGKPENQRRVLTEYFKRTSNYTDDKISRMIDSLHATGHLESEAETALSELKDIGEEERTRLIEEQKARTEQEIAENKKFRENITKKISESEYIQDLRKSKVKAFLFNIQEFEGGNKETQFNRVLKNIASNPEHLVQMADLLLDYDNKKGFTLDRFTRRAATKGAKTLKDQLQSITNNRNNINEGTAVTVTNTQDFPWDAFLEQDF